MPPLLNAPASAPPLGPSTAAPASAKRLLETRQVSLRFGHRSVLREVDFTIDRGEIVTLIGPNGGGKTTLIRLLLGLLSPSSGEVVRHPALTVGYVPQRLAIDPILPLTVQRLMTLTQRHSRAEILAALELTGAPHLLKQPVQRLSGGEFQRVQIARALLRRPELLVLDEPVQGVDYKGEAALYRLISHLRERLGCGVLLVSHDLHLVMAATDRVVCLNGHVCCTGIPQEVARHSAFKQLFGDAYAVYQHHHGHHPGYHLEAVPTPPTSPAV